jgi:ribosome maturation factor RimP
MASREEITEKVRVIAERVAAGIGVEIYDVQFLGGGRHRMLRIYIDKLEGVTHGDCEFISHNVGTILDVEDVIPGERYTLEVSSPGVERKLRQPREFERFVGQRIKVVLKEPVENQHHLVGALTGFSEGVITLEPSPGHSVRVPLEQVERANLKFDW